MGDCRVLALDFDGVICNSIHECMEVAVNSYHGYEPGDGKWLDYSEFDTELSALFIKHRPFVRPAGEYWGLVNQIQVSGKEISFEKFREDVDSNRAEVETFRKRFFGNRELLYRKSTDSWLAKHSGYTEFNQYWSDVSSRFKNYIVTAKNHKAVVRLLNYLGIEIAENNIYSSDMKISKSEAIRRIADLESCSCSDIVFVDDNERHLIDVMKTGAECRLALWGYNTGSNPELTAEGLENLGEVIKLTGEI